MKNKTIVYGASLVLNARTHVYAEAKIPENNPTKEVIIVEENSGLTINNIPKIATIIAMI